jgi:hypothetical protein
MIDRTDMNSENENKHIVNCKKPSIFICDESDNLGSQTLLPSVCQSASKTNKNLTYSCLNWESHRLMSVFSFSSQLGQFIHKLHKTVSTFTVQILKYTRSCIL